MSLPAPALRAVVCDDRPAVVASLAELLHASGFALAATTGTLPELAAAVRAHGARVAVVALPLVGMSGMDAVRTLREAAPWCEVVVLEAAGTLALAALEAGARAAVQDDDLRALRPVLLAVASERPTVSLPAARPQSDDVTGSVSTKPPS